MSYTSSPSLDQGALLNFENNFFALAQQERSKLEASSACMYLSSGGKTSNMARVGRLELTEVNTRNPDKIFGDYALDNRRMTKRRFTKTIPLDALYDINELIADPTSTLVQQLVAAKNRVIDRIIVSAALGNVLIGSPDAAGSTVSAANDGVVTVSATGGFTYSTVQSVIQNFVNSELDTDYFGSTLCVTGKEQNNMMNEDELINNDYVNIKPVPAGRMDSASSFNVTLFSGSVNGGLQVLNPILPEASTERSCIVLAPKSVAISMELAKLEVEKLNGKVNSYGITIDLWINAMRTEGARVQAITTTM